MIPGMILKFLQDRGAIAVSGTREANRVPHVHHVSGWDWNLTNRPSDVPSIMSTSIICSVHWKTTVSFPSRWNRLVRPRDLPVEGELCWLGRTE